MAINKEYVEKHIIFKTTTGSRAYGIHHKDSDYDVAGVMVPGKEYFYGTKRFEQFNGFEGDQTIYDTRKALRLIADNNPNMMELAWAPERCWMKITPQWRDVMEARDMFLSKKCCFTFSGYAISQLNRIKTHRQFLLQGKPKEPIREEYGLPEFTVFPTLELKSILYSAIEIIPDECKGEFNEDIKEIHASYVIPTLLKYIDVSKRRVIMDWIQQSLKSQAKVLVSSKGFIKDEYVEMAHKELNYYNAKKDYDQYALWLKTRNKSRQELEAKYGFDTKHAGHLVRLLRMGVEILETGKVLVDRRGIDAEELISIRNGAWKYEKIEEYARSMENKMNELYKTSPLPKAPDREKIDELCIKIVDSCII